MDRLVLMDDTNQKTSLVPWNGILGIFLTFFNFLITQILALLIMLIIPLIQGQSYKQAVDWINKSITSQFFYVLFAEVISVAIVFLIIKLYKSKLSVIGLRRFKYSDILYGIIAVIAYFGFFLLSVLVVRLVFPNLNINQKQDVGFNNVTGLVPLSLTFFSLVVLPPIAEEILFRGFLYSSVRKLMPKLLAAIVTSLLFGAAHLLEGVGGLLWIGFIDTFILSMVLVYLREKTGGIYAGMFTHGLKNLIAFVSLYIAPLLATYFHW